MIGIILLAVFLRFWGISWGLPDTTHYYSYHPDENIVMGVARQVNPLNGQFDTKFYNYGSLYIYMVNLGIVFSDINFDAKDIAGVVSALAKTFLIGRYIAMILGILTVYLVFLLGRRAYGRGVGILAALFMAIMPIHVMHSKFLAVDVPATFFVTMALIFALRISQENYRLRDYLLAGLFVGFAAAIKYNAGLVLLAPIVAHFVHSNTDAQRPTFNIKLFVLPIAAGLAFLIGTPGVLINFAKFSQDFKYEMHHVRTGHGLVFVKTGIGWIYHFTHSLWPGMGLPLLLLAVIGLIYALRKRTVSDWILLSFLLTYYLMIGAAQVRFARYIIPLLPIFAILAARVSVELLSYLSAKDPSRHASRYATIVLLVLISGYSLIYSVSIDNMFSRPDTRDLAAAWVKSNVPQGASIGFPTIPWFYTPPIDPSMGAAASGPTRFDKTTMVTEYRLVASRDTEWDSDELLRDLPDHVIISQFEYEDRLRLGDPEALKYFDILKQHYREEKEFSDLPSFLGMHIPLLNKLPHDMSYACPRIVIYVRKAG